MTKTTNTPSNPSTPNSPNSLSTPSNPNTPTKPPKPFKSIFRRVTKWQDLWFYQKSEVLYQMTYVFCERFLPKYGDRTVDQMVQAARSGKQNIVEGSEDGKTSTETEIRLLNVARASIGELRSDYLDYINTRELHKWTPDDTRFQPMQDFTKSHNKISDYEPYFNKWSAEEMANIGLTLCFQVDTMMNKYMESLEKSFVTEGGIKERMHQARTGYREQQDRHLAELEQSVPALQQQLTQAKAEADKWKAEAAKWKAEADKWKAEAAKWKGEAAKWKAKYDDLKQRALKAYQAKEEEIERLKREKG